MFFKIENMIFDISYDVKSIDMNYFYGRPPFSTSTKNEARLAAALIGPNLNFRAKMFAGKRASLYFDERFRELFEGEFVSAVNAENATRSEEEKIFFRSI